MNYIHHLLTYLFYASKYRFVAIAVINKIFKCIQNKNWLHIIQKLASENCMMHTQKELANIIPTAVLFTFIECSCLKEDLFISISDAIEQPSHQSELHVGCVSSLVFSKFLQACLLYTSPSPRDGLLSRMPSSA